MHHKLISLFIDIMLRKAKLPVVTLPNEKIYIQNCKYYMIIWVVGASKAIISLVFQNLIVHIYYHHNQEFFFSFENESNVIIALLKSLSNKIA